MFSFSVTVFTSLSFTETKLRVASGFPLEFNLIVATDVRKTGEAPAPHRSLQF